MKPDYRSNVQSNARHAFLAFTICRILHPRIHPSVKHAPSVDMLRARFNMSRATAFRWRQAWFSANGLPMPVNPGGAPGRRGKRNPEQIGLFDGSAP